ncbi:methylated-DNA--[protein]-cysteine S-methyltransferase [Pseudahrensia aquimaris]|uniref:Methylated-DNA--[protein]-cysteine S-methyltransferase n=1 Tax=Pseudahrensia aquimaris TaxID=744461 RepID=A0ABW3FGY0_9HYPH
MTYQPDMTSLTPSADLHERHSDYVIVRQVLEHLTENWRDHPTMDELSALTGLGETRLQKTFTRWAGLSPKAFLQALTLDHAKRLLGDGLPLLDTAYELGLSGPGRLHDLFVTHEAMSPGQFKAKGEGLEIRYGFHPSPFGMALIMATDRGLAGIAFADDDTGESLGRHQGKSQIFDRKTALEDMVKRWPKAQYFEDEAATAPYAARVFDPSKWRAEEPLRVVLIGTDFQIRVWEGLLNIPLGGATTYSGLAQSLGRPDAPRAVGTAVGRNPISFVVPCHRVLGKDGTLTGYHWGLTRKRAMLGWEAGVVNAA